MPEKGSVPAAALEALREAGDGWLSPGRETIVAAAPGRLDVMGGIADYSGAVVLEATIGDLATVALQRRTDDLLRVRTTGGESSRLAVDEFALRVADFYGSDGTTLRSYAQARALFPPEARWAAYVLGVFYVLLAEGELDRLPSGADLLVHSTVPLGAGVASSAALEVAAMRAAAAAFGAPTTGLRLASLCQIVENQVVGAPCGIMDQVTCTLGEAGRLLALLCRPHEVRGWHAPPPGFVFIGLDSGVKHAVGGVRYPRVRCAAFMGRRIIQEALRRSGDDPARADYLCSLTPAEFRARFRDLLPAQLLGRDFLDRWGETGDAATTVDPAVRYPVRGATAHPIEEHARVQRFIRTLQAAERVTPRTAAGTETAHRQMDALMRAAGRLMYGSHRSYSRNCGLGARETDLLVTLARAAGPEQGIYGAKITGGGSGGTVAMLVAAAPDGSLSATAAEAVAHIRAQYGQATGRVPRQIAGSRPGAAAIAPVTLPWP